MTTYHIVSSSEARNGLVNWNITGLGEGLKFWQVSMPVLAYPAGRSWPGEAKGRSKGHMWRQLFLRLVTCAALTTAAAAGADLTTAAEFATTYRSVLIGGVPHVKQKPDFCGEACAEMYLTKLGKAMDQDYVFDQAGVDPMLGRGCCTRELATALRRIGFRTGNIWYVVTASHAEQQLDSQFSALHRDLAAGVPSIICMHYDDQPNTTEHFRLILGLTHGPMK